MCVFLVRLPLTFPLSVCSEPEGWPRCANSTRPLGSTSTSIASAASRGRRAAGAKAVRAAAAVGGGAAVSREVPEVPTCDGGHGVMLRQGYLGTEEGEAAILRQGYMGTEEGVAGCTDHPQSQLHSKVPISLSTYLSPFQSPPPRWASLHKNHGAKWKVLTTAPRGSQQQQQLRRQGSTLAPLYTQTRAGRWTSLSPGSCMGWGRMKCRHKPSILQTHHELFPTHTGVMRCTAQPLRGSTTTKRSSDSTNTNTP